MNGTWPAPSLGPARDAPSFPQGNDRHELVVNSPRPASCPLCYPAEWTNIRFDILTTQKQSAAFSQLRLLRLTRLNVREGSKCDPVINIGSDGVTGVF